MGNLELISLQSSEGARPWEWRRSLNSLGWKTTLKLFQHILTLLSIKYLEMFQYIVDLRFRLLPMKQAPFFTTLINSCCLIVMGLWGYVASGAVTALIPIGFGIGFLVMSPGVKSYNKAIAHIVVFLALVTGAALIAPLLRAFSNGNTLGILRLSLMLLTNLIALGFYIKSFIDARRSRPDADTAAKP